MSKTRKQKWAEELRAGYYVKHAEFGLSEVRLVLNSGYGTFSILLTPVETDEDGLEQEKFWASLDEIEPIENLRWKRGTFTRFGRRRDKNERYKPKRYKRVRRPEVH